MMTTTIPTDDFKLSAEDRLFKNTEPVIPTPAKPPKTTFILFTLVIGLCVSQAWLWQHMTNQNQETSHKINSLQSTLENSRTQVGIIDQQLNEAFLQGSSQIKLLAEKIARLEKYQATLPTITVEPTTDPSSTVVQTLSIKVDEVTTNFKALQQAQVQLEKVQSELQQDLTTLKGASSALQTTQTEQQTLTSKLEDLTQQVSDLKSLSEVQQQNEQSLQSLQSNLKTVQSNVQELTLQVSTLADDTTPSTTTSAASTTSDEATRSLDLYRQQINERLDQLTETVRKLKYPQSGQENP